MSKPTTEEWRPVVGYENGYDTADRVIALATIEQLVLERVIGEDNAFGEETSMTPSEVRGYNQAKAEQRQALKQLIGDDR